MASPTKIIAMLVLFSLVAPLTRATKVSYCKKNEDYAVKVSGVDINPNPVVRGKPATFSISASTDTPIASGKLKIEVSYFGIHVHSEDHDLCDETTCPVSAGNFKVSHTQELPGFTPPGSYKLTMKMIDGSETLTCITFSFKIGLGESVADS